ncbi:MAG: Nif3-like dinuclear metal center hexameric protein [Chitinophagales bacterium]|nr:Nif3-like dinuclear metal center hexameric protein [Chitinophagales bacterium]
MKIADIIDTIDAFAPKQYQESYDNAGLIVGDKSAECTGVLLCLDTIEAVIDEAIAKNCNLVVAHHPIVFSGIKQLNGKNYVERVVIKAIKNDIAIYACHTNLDNVQLGVNHKIGEKLGLQNLKILAPKKSILKKLYTYIPTAQKENLLNALYQAGAGNIGNYSNCSFSTEGIGSFKANENANPTVGKINETHYENETKVEVLFPIHAERNILQALFKHHPYEEVAYEIITLDNMNQNIGSGMIGELNEAMAELDFLKLLKEKMQCQCIRHTKLLNRPIKTVAFCGGAGSFLLKNAIAAKADIFITGDFKYHEFFDADNQIVIADIGHYESEQYTTEIFYNLLTKKFRNFAVQISTINTNPINYL